MQLTIRGGMNLSLLEIDEALRDCLGVAFPFKNSFEGEEVALYVVPELARRCAKKRSCIT